MKRFVLACAFALAALTLGSCETMTTAAKVAQVASTPVSTVEAQKAVDLMQLTHRTVLKFEVKYILQPACGLQGSPPAPLCASYAVGLQMKKADDVFMALVAKAQAEINKLGNDPKVIEAAVSAAQVALVGLQQITQAYGGK